MRDAPPVGPKSFPVVFGYALWFSYRLCTSAPGTSHDVLQLPCCEFETTTPSWKLPPHKYVGFMLEAVCIAPSSHFGLHGSVGFLCGK